MNSMYLQLLLVPVLIAANAFFVASEYVVVAIRRPQIATMGLHSKLTARWLTRLRKNMAVTIGGIQVCITMTNLMLGWLGEPAMTSLLQSILSPLNLLASERVATGVSVGLAFLVVTLATVILSELLPKALTLQHTMLVARLVAGPLVLILLAISPLVWIMAKLANGISRLMRLGPVHIEETPAGVDELMAIVEDAGEHGSLGGQERALILNTLGLSRLCADDVMVPRVKVAYLDLQRSMRHNRDVMEEHLYSRLPLCNGGMDKVVGIVYTKEFLTANEETDESSVLQLICRPAIFAPATISLDRLLTLFLENHCRMIVLVDEYGGVDGIATLTDVMDMLLKQHKVNQ